MAPLAVNDRVRITDRGPRDVLSGCTGVVRRVVYVAATREGPPRWDVLIDLDQPTPIVCETLQWRSADDLVVHRDLKPENVTKRKDRHG